MQINFIENTVKRKLLCRNFLIAATDQSLPVSSDLVLLIFTETYNTFGPSEICRNKGVLQKNANSCLTDANNALIQRNGNLFLWILTLMLR